MFIPIVIFAALNNALQIALMAEYFRKMDTLSAVAYRGLSLAISMSPLLLFVPFDQVHIDGQFFIYIAGASVAAVIANWTMAIALHYLSVPISTALGFSFWSIVISLLAFIFAGESLTLKQTSLIVIIVGVSIILGIVQNTENHLLENNRKVGVMLTLIFGIAIGSASLLVGKASRMYHPFATGYFWETGIGLLSAIIAFNRRWFSQQTLVKIKTKDFFRIMLFSAPTVLGTGLFAYSATQGKLAIVSAIFITATMLFSAILAYVRYREKLNLKQMLLFAAIILLIVTLKMVS